MKVSKMLNTLCLTTALLIPSSAIVVVQSNNSLAAPSDTFCNFHNPLNRLLANHSLTLGQCLVSNNQLYAFQLQTDGNLVLYNRYNQPVWAAGTNGKPVNRCTMQSDGNLVIYSTSNKALWASHTDGHPNSYLIVQDDGNVVIYQNVGGIDRPIWATNTVGR